MKIPAVFVAAMLLQSLHPALAGSLATGQWTLGSCGDKPAPPVVNVRDADAYNKSVKLTNEWQEKASVYYDCVIKEANADTAAITAKANSEQAEYKQTFEGIVSALDAAKKKLEQ